MTDPSNWEKASKRHCWNGTSLAEVYESGFLNGCQHAEAELGNEYAIVCHWKQKVEELEAEINTIRNDQIYVKAANERDKFREALVDMRDNGVRFDLNPTVGWNDEASLAMAYLNYIKRIDESVREYARDALGKE